ncbi:phage tail assembly chaperone GT [Staphylococcus argensis]|nr:hypothetical protein [Staphylococcus argensis]
MKKLMLTMMKEGDKDINQILDMPFALFMDLVEENTQPEEQESESMIQAFM